MEVVNMDQLRPQAQALALQWAIGRVGGPGAHMGDPWSFFYVRKRDAPNCIDLPAGKRIKVAITLEPDT